MAALKQTTVGYVNRNWKVPPPGSQWAKGLALLAQIGAAQQPPVTTGSGVAIIGYGGKLPGYSHLTDGTYQAALGDWNDAPLLATTSQGFAYTDGEHGWTSPPPVFTVNLFDPNAYVASVSAHLKATGCKGVFIDNIVNTNSGALLPFLHVAGPALIAEGFEVMLNVSNYVPGKTETFDGAAWAGWLAQLKGCATHAMLEYWQQYSGGPNQDQVLTGGNWQLCQPAVAGAHAVGMSFVGLTYGPLSSAVYGRASMILAGAKAGDLFMSTGTTPGDPYNAGWTMPAPSNVSVDSSAGTATL